jgi:hypothetical protein
VWAAGKWAGVEVDPKRGRTAPDVVGWRVGVLRKEEEVDWDDVHQSLASDMLAV